MYLIRALMIGNSGVGKTSLLISFHENTFSETQKTTIGVDYRAKRIDVDGTPVKLQIWDTAGQERFRAMTMAFYHRAQGIVLTFDVTNRESFEDLPSWLRDAREGAEPGCAIILCANKCDIPADRWEVSQEDAQRYADEEGLPFFMCSASKQENVPELYTALARIVLERSKDKVLELRDSEYRETILDPAKVKRPKGCCSNS